MLVFMSPSLLCYHGRVEIDFTNADDLLHPPREDVVEHLVAVALEAMADSHINDLTVGETFSACFTLALRAARFGQEVGDPITKENIRSGALRILAETADEETKH